MGQSQVLGLWCSWLEGTLWKAHQNPRRRTEQNRQSVHQMPRPPTLLRIPRPIHRAWKSQQSRRRRYHAALALCALRKQAIQKPAKSKDLPRRRSRSNRIHSRNRKMSGLGGFSPCPKRQKHRVLGRQRPERLTPQEPATAGHHNNLQIPIIQQVVRQAALPNLPAHPHFTLIIFSHSYSIYSLRWTSTTSRISSAPSAPDGSTPIITYPLGYSVGIPSARVAWRSRRRRGERGWCVCIIGLSNLLRMWRLICIFSRRLRGCWRTPTNQKLGALSIKKEMSWIECSRREKKT